jgi:hypothetical protein
MKRILVLPVLLLLALTSVTAQTDYTTSDERIVVNKSDLTPDQIAKLKAEAQLELMEKKLETYGNWVGVGGEIGQAIDEGLNSVVDVAEKFGKTEVGKFTLVLIAWKVVGQDVVRILLGLIFIGMFTWLLIYSFRRTCIDRRVLIKNENPGFMKYPKLREYKIVEPLFGDGEGLGIIRIAHLIFFLIGIWITYAIMF